LSTHTQSYETTVAGGKHWSLTLSAGSLLRLVDLEGGANVGMLFYNPGNTLERYNAPDTLKCQHTFKLTAGHCLYSDMGRIFCSIVADSGGWHATVCGNSTKRLVAGRWGEKSYQQYRNDWTQNGHDAFIVEGGKYGLGRRDLVANISHDLRTPLTSLHGYLEMLRLKAASLSIEERQRYLDVALAQSAKVGRLAQELFELARLESGLVQPEMETFSLPDLVQDVLQKFELAAEARQQRLSVEIPPTLPGVRADLGMIERVLTNLLDNAIRHTPAGTEIVVSLRNQPDGVQVEVSDTGPGIPEALRDGLFTRASRLLRGAPPSGGLGLIIVQRILQLHGGEVRLAAARGKGAAFLFTLSVG